MSSDSNPTNSAMSKNKAGGSAAGSHSGATESPAKKQKSEIATAAATATARDAPSAKGGSECKGGGGSAGNGASGDGKAKGKGKGPRAKPVPLAELSASDIEACERVLAAMCAGSVPSQLSFTKGQPDPNTLSDSRPKGAAPADGTASAATETAATPATAAVGAGAGASAAGAGAAAAADASADSNNNPATDRRLKGIRGFVFELSQKLERSQFGGMDKEQYTAFILRKQQKKEKDAQRARLKDLDRKHINTASLRSSRLQALSALTLPDADSQRFINSTLAAIEGPRALPMLTAPDGSDSSASASGSASASASASAPTAQPASAPAATPDHPMSSQTPPPPTGVSFAGSIGVIERSQRKRESRREAARLAATLVASSSSSSAAASSDPMDATATESGDAGAAAAPKKRETAKERKERLKNLKAQHQAEFDAEVKRLNDAKQQQTSTGAGTSAAPAPPAAAAASATVSDETPKPDGANAGSGAAAGAGAGKRELSYARSCYVCKKRFLELHHFYDQLCAPCAKLNWEKRNLKVDLTNRVILVTGCRVKIGFEAGLRLLRCGATLIATSRFPHDTAARYAKCEDFNVWKHRLHVYGLDLRDLRSVVRFTELICSRYSRLDAIINNAAQTVRRPPAYYRHLMDTELTPISALDPQLQSLIKGDSHSDFVFGKPKSGSGASSSSSSSASGSAAKGSASGSASSSSGAAKSQSSVTIHEVHDDAPASAAAGTTSPAAPAGTDGKSASASTAAATSEEQIAQESRGMGMDPRGASVMSAVVDVIRGDPAAGASGVQNVAAAMSQVAVMAGDRVFDTRLFPTGAFDVTGQQLDLRRVNSWLLLLDQVDPSELVEVFAINALAPFIINARLKRLLMHPYASDKWVVNVSAMEGKFYRFKGPQHPHTNMAKAALNMLTRTSAQDYARDGIYMTSVDTGWINDENPFEKSQHNLRANFQTPIDEVDAAARIIDPILSGIATGKNVHGVFLKDYAETEW